MCQGAITIDGDKIERNVAYYVIGHASKFVTQNAVRIESNTTADLSHVAFKTPEGNVVLIVANKGKQSQTFAIGYKDRQVQTTLDAGAVATYVWKQ
jgi:glucosylceramidase